MKNLYLLVIIILLNPLSSFSQDVGKRTMEEIRVKQIENNHKPELWDMGRMKEDINDIIESYPLRYGAFPVPHYKSLFGMPYKGGGSISNHFARSLPEYRLELKGKEIGFCSFFIGNSPLYEEERRDKTFFTILTVIDSINADNFALGGSMFLSRNHPDYGGEGSFITKENKVDFVAFTTPDKGSFAVVNMRLFHLEHGNVVIIAPHKDGSFRSLQINGDVPTGEKIYEYIRENLLQRPGVSEILTADGVID